VAMVPEPSTFVLATFGVASGFAMYRRRAGHQ
jgi:hypothetical protein